MRSFFIFDVESVGLHGEGFAVAGGVYLENAAPQWEFKYSCSIDECGGNSEGRHWVKENVPVMKVTHHTPKLVRDAFWREWVRAKEGGAIMAAECGWPVEARFLMQCIEDDIVTREWDGPYPLMEIASFMVSAGMDPMKTYERGPSEMPAHDPLADARLSARLLSEAIDKVRERVEIFSRFRKDQPLVCGIEDDQLVVRIGIDVLAFASKPENGGVLDDCLIRDGGEREFAKDVANEMMRDNCEGPYPFPDFLDRMIQAAADSGSAALKWKKKSRR